MVAGVFVGKVRSRRGPVVLCLYAKILQLAWYVVYGPYGVLDAVTGWSETGCIR